MYSNGDRWGEIDEYTSLFEATIEADNKYLAAHIALEPYRMNRHTQTHYTTRPVIYNIEKIR